MAEFNNNPSEFVDFNDLFPVLNEKVGLTYEQWRKAIENINFVKANLGVSDVEKGEVNITVVEDDSLVGLDITTREGIVEKNGVQRTVIYIDFDLKVPSGNVKSVNGQTGVVVLTSDDLGAVSKKGYTLNSEQTITNDDTNGILIKSAGTLAGSDNATSSINVSGGRISFETSEDITINGEKIAVMSDLADVSGGVETLVGTSDKYINLYNDMEAGKYYIVSGYIYGVAGNTDYISLPVLAYRYSDDKVRLFNSAVIANQYGLYKWKSSPTQDCVVNIYSSGIGGLDGNINLINKINGDNEGEPIDIYAPTTSGAEGQILTSSGSGSPVWSDLPSSGIEQLVGTEDAPINFATSMEAGKWYIISGIVNYSATKNININHSCFINRIATSMAVIYGAWITSSIQNYGDYQRNTQIIFNDETGYITTTSVCTGVTVNGGVSETSIYAPTSRGSSGQVLNWDSSGKPTWITPNYATQEDITTAINGAWEGSY